MFCENLSENEAKFLILEQTRFLRVLTRKDWFSVNMPSTKGHNYWTQLPTTMKFCQNVPHMYILEAHKFQVWTNISILVKNRRKWGKFSFCSLWVVKIGKFLKLFQYISTIEMVVLSKFVSRRSKPLDYIAYSIFKDLNKRIYIFVQRSILKSPQILKSKTFECVRCCALTVVKKI